MPCFLARRNIMAIFLFLLELSIIDIFLSISASFLSCSFLHSRLIFSILFLLATRSALVGSFGVFFVVFNILMVFIYKFFKLLYLLFLLLVQVCDASL